LPAELPRDASSGFGRDLIRHIIPCLIGEGPKEIIENATIAKNGAITERFKYLEDWVA
ncbi:MAG: alanine dehydrogenase, partial [Bacteroidetes bacterium]|nr:alanine dehydrogenase [Bacteroidota bacterium]